MALEKIRPGAKLKIHYYPGNINNRVIHIVTIVDEDQVVFKTWSRSKKRWIYEIRDMLYFEITENGGNLK